MPSHPTATTRKGAAKFVTAAPTLPAPKIPSAVPWFFCSNHLEVYAHADDERSAGQAQPQRRDQKDRVGRYRGEQPDGDRCDQHLHRKKHASAELLRPNAEKYPADGTGQNGRRNQQSELGVVEAEFLLDRHADYGKNRPYGEADRKCERAQSECAVLVAARNAVKFMHDVSPTIYESSVAAGSIR